MPTLAQKDKDLVPEDWFMAIHKIARDINSTIGLDECLKEILDKTTKLLGVEMASVMLIDRQKNELSIRYAKGLSEKIIEQAKSILSQAEPKEVAVWVAKHGEPLLIEDIEKDGRFLKRNGKKYSNNSLLSVPLAVRGQTIGVLNVNNKKDKEIFTQNDLKMLAVLSDEVSIAIYNNRLYEELRVANGRLRELDQLKSDFVSNVSHELNTPLATSRYLLSVILKGLAGELKPKQSEYLIIIQNNIDRLTRLIDNLLDLSRIESGRFELKREPLQLEHLIKEVVQVFSLQAQAKSVTLKYVLAGGLPKVYADKDEISQVLINLLDNAMKFTPQGGQIIIYLRRSECEAVFDSYPLSAGSPDAKNDFLQVCVVDTGCGISKDDTDKIFVKFQRILQGPDSAKVKGTGLGLAITKEIVKRHNGDIFVESAPGEGSKFYFNLPVYDEESSFTEHLNQQIQAASSSKGNVTLLAFEIAHLDKLKRELSDEQLNSVLDDFYSISKKNIRRPTDLVRQDRDRARMIIIADANSSGAAILKERFLKDLAGFKLHIQAGREMKFDIKTGFVTFPDDGITSSELINRLQERIK